MDDKAAALGLQAGRKATDAKALVPELNMAEAEPQADARALTALAHWCMRFSPGVAQDPPDGLFLDVAGVAHLWGGERRMMDDLSARLAAQGLPFQMAIADTPGAAWALARYEDRAIAPPADQAALLAPLPPAGLRLEAQTTAQLQRLGLTRISQLMALPRAPLARRFGAGLLVRLDQALGAKPEALAFRRPPSPWFARLSFAEPISAPPDMARAARDICVQLCERLEVEGQGARRFELAYHRLDGAAPAVSVGLSLAGRDPQRISRLLTPKIETIDPGFGVEVVTLMALEVEPLANRQSGLDGARATAVEDGLAPLVDRLVNRLGNARVWRAAPVESHVPEQAASRGRPLGEGPPARGWDPEAPRPLRLFRRPERLEAVLAPIPDDPPRQFTWRGRAHRVRRAEGPERIAEEWWRPGIGQLNSSHLRDYYRVEDEDGGRFWIFRAGLYGGATPPDWWLHGLFG